MKKTYLREIKSNKKCLTYQLVVVTFENEDERKEDKKRCEYDGKNVRYFELKEIK